MAKMIEHRYGAHPGKGCNRSRVRTLLADHDPLSRRVLSDLLSESGELDVIARIDSHDPLEEWPLRQAEVVVLGVSPLEHLVDTVRELASRKVTVLLIGVDWTTDSLDAVLGAGAAGCLVKDAELSGLVTAVQAVASGHVVLSRDLLEFHLPRLVLGKVRHGSSIHSLTDREHEVLALLAGGMSTAEVAKSCGVSTATIKSHVSHVITKLGVRNRLEAVLLIRGALDPVPGE